MNFGINNAQSKKEQIEILTNRVDSLDIVLKTDRNSNNQKELVYKEQISSLQKQLENLNGTLTKTKEELAKEDVELKTSEQDLLNKSMEIKVLGNQIKEKEKLIANLRSKLDYQITPKFKVDKLIDEFGDINWQVSLISNGKLIDSFFPSWEYEPEKKEGELIIISSEVWDRTYYFKQTNQNQLEVKLSFHSGGNGDEEIEMESVYIKNANDIWTKESCSGLCSE